jgi:membrane protein DedA with SNARE-associated domain
MSYFDHLLPTVHHYIEVYGSLGVFLASIIEEIIPPIPSALVQGLGGLLVMGDTAVSAVSILQVIVLVAIPAALGVTIGSLPYVYLARKYGIQLIEKYGKYMGTSISDWHKLEKKLNESRYDDLAFISLRSFPVVPAIVLAIYGGVIEMPVWKYLYLSFLGVLIRATALATVAWILGREILENITHVIDILEKLGLVLIASVLIYFIYRKYTNTNFVTQEK